MNILASRTLLTAGLLLFVALLSGCANLTGFQSTTALDCNITYTRCGSDLASETAMTASPNPVEFQADIVSNPNQALYPPSDIAPILFGFDQATVPELDLKKVAGYLLTTPSAVVTLHGYTDPIGSVDYNLQLSQKRADYIKGRLQLMGVAERQIKVAAHGETNLQIMQQDVRKVESKTLLVSLFGPNRRVEFEFNSTAVTN